MIVSRRYTVNKEKTHLLTKAFDDVPFRASYDPYLLDIRRSLRTSRRKDIYTYLSCLRSDFCERSLRRTL